MSAVAKRYALALIATAREANALDAVEQDLEELDHLLSTSEPFSDFVAHALLTEEEQTRILEALFGDRLHKLTKNLLLLLVRRERLSDLSAIVDRARDDLRDAKGILPVRVVSAAEMPKTQQDALKKKLAARTGKTIELDCRVDADLIGGFQLRMGDLVEDYSLATRLETFKQNVLNA